MKYMIEDIVRNQRQFFQTGATIEVRKRIEALKRLRSTLQEFTPMLLEALRSDLGKSASEGYMCEVGLTLSEISHTLSHVKSWAKPERRIAPLTNFPATQKIFKDPYGVVLIMSPWNYPVLLTLGPLIAAVSAGNCACVKPSAYSPSTSAVMQKLIEKAFPPEYVSVITGGRAENQTLLDQKFDYIFFTGGVSVGKMVMEKAARHLTPVTLELGGKSPVIIDSHCDLKLAARRVAFGKWLNCGQTCIAPDYVLCHKDVHDRFVELLKDEVMRQYGSEPLSNHSYGKVVNRKHFDRISGLIDTNKTIYGGTLDTETLRISPTIMTGVTADDAAMQEEIFGPVLPIIKVDSMETAFDFIQQRPHPLALYLFTTSGREKRKFLSRLSFGGGCVNDTIMHIATHNMPFGGVGNSGMGSYHGKFGFDTFTHRKSVVFKPNFLDLPLRYQPYSKWKDKIIRMFM